MAQDASWLAAAGDDNPALLLQPPKGKSERECVPVPVYEGTQPRTLCSSAAARQPGTKQGGAAVISWGQLCSGWPVFCQAWPVCFRVAPLLGPGDGSYSLVLLGRLLPRPGVLACCICSMCTSRTCVVLQAALPCPLLSRCSWITPILSRTRLIVSYQAPQLVSGWPISWMQPVALTRLSMMPFVMAQ